MSVRPNQKPTPISNEDDAYLMHDNARPVEGHDEWVEQQVRTAIENRKTSGSKGFKPWRDIMSKFGL